MNPDPYSFAAQLAKVTGATVIASVGGADQSKVGTDLSKEATMGAWYAFDKDNPAGRALNEGSGCKGASCSVMKPESHLKK